MGLIAAALVYCVAASFDPNLPKSRNALVYAAALGPIVGSLATFVSRRLIDLKLGRKLEFDFNVRSIELPSAWEAKNALLAIAIASIFAAFVLVSVEALEIPPAPSARCELLRKC